MKAYVFNNNEIILINNQEQFLKISIKERSHNLQAMLLTNIESMEQLVKCGLATKEMFLGKEVERKLKSKVI